MTALCVPQKRRSGRQVKRRKYNEDLDFKVVDDDGETIAVLGAGRTSALSASTLAWQAEVGLGGDWAQGASCLPQGASGCRRKGGPSAGVSVPVWEAAGWLCTKGWARGVQVQLLPSGSEPEASGKCSWLGMPLEA